MNDTPFSTYLSSIPPSSPFSAAKGYSSTLPGPENIVRHTLSNGITILVRSNFNNPSINIGGYLQTGSLYEPDDKLGLADFTTNMLTRGTQQRNFQQIYDTLESVGASFSYRSGVHTSSFAGKALAEDLDLLLEILAETLQQPSFPNEYVERLRNQLLTHLSIRAQSTDSMASLTFDKIVYQDHPYGRPEDGYPETISAISINDLVDFHRLHFGPRGMVVAVVGAVEPVQAIEMINNKLGSWQNPDQPEARALPPLLQLKEVVTQKVRLEDKSQANILIGVAGPPRNHQNYIAASLGNSVLGQFGMYGRIGQVVREEEGLAYFAYSVLSGGIGPGPWYVSIGTAPQNIERVIQLVRGELARFSTSQVTRDELNDSQAQFIGILPLSLETNEGIVAALLNLERYQLGLDYYLLYENKVRSVTPEVILDVVRQFIDAEHLGIAIAGPISS